MDLDLIFNWLGIVVVGAPTLLMALMGLSYLVNQPLSEHALSRSTQIAVMTGLVAAIAVLVLMLVTGVRFVPIEFGNWVVIPQEHFHFHLKIVFDRLSVPFCILIFVLVATTGAFANRYLHREPGYGRFFMLYSFFLLGMVLAALAGTIETLFLGWELVGLSSALLVAYFHERRSPVVNGQRVWSVYRVADAAFLGAAVLLHHLRGEGDFMALMGTGPWPEGAATLSPRAALLVGSLLLLAAAGKSALVPFSGWLPRAMEGPTPSSAIFYGALSVHLGVYLLLRVSPLLDLSPTLRAMVIILGLATALFASGAASVQSDIKTGLAFASLTQVGIITVEIGLGFRYLALVHIIGHACLRMLQLLRAPTLIRDYHSLENAIGGRLQHRPSRWLLWLPEPLQLRLYRLFIERGELDALLDQIVAVWVGMFRFFDTWERRWTDWLSGTRSRESDRIASGRPVEDLR
ncbi:MAG: oxidoreductase [Pirellulales bacterium]|nr:oxidoreductase [Pirellulales bacterium]